MFDAVAWEASTLTVQQLADACGSSYSTAWRWIHHQSKPSPMARRRLVKLGLWLHQRKPTASDIKRVVESAGGGT